MKLWVSVEDNVLDSDAWPVVCLTLDAYGHVLQQEQIKQGVYEIPAFDTLVDLYAWLNVETYERTHPVTFNTLVPAPE